MREGGFIRDGYDAEVDRLRDILVNGKDLVAGIEAREKERTGIKSLKVGYNKVFGYYIEVSKSYYDQVPDTYIRKQTLVNCERYITQELKDMEHTILTAQDRLTALEYELFCSIREQTAARVGDIQRSAAAAAQVDVLTSFACVAAENGYCRPEVDLSDTIESPKGGIRWWKRCSKGAFFRPQRRPHGRRGEYSGHHHGTQYGGQVHLICVRWPSLCSWLRWAPSSRPSMPISASWTGSLPASAPVTTSLPVSLPSWWRCSEVAELLKNATRKAFFILDEIGRGTEHLRRHVHRRVLWYCADKKRSGRDPLCHPLPRTHRPGGDEIPRGEELSHRGEKEEGRHPLPAQDRPRRRGPELWHRSGQAGRCAGADIRRARTILEELEQGAGAGTASAAAPPSGAGQMSLMDWGPPRRQSACAGWM